MITLAKSQLPNGQYKPANQLNPGQRTAVANGAQVRTVARARAVAAPGPRRSMANVYANHGFGMATHSAKEMFKSPTTPSAVHPNIHYGSTIHPDHHAALDAKINPKQAAALKHPVVIHRSVLPDGIHAAAVGSHVTTGHRGHVVLGHGSLDAKGEAGPFIGVNGKQILSHEIAHASLKHSNPRKFFTGHDAKAAARSMGEEGRADAVSQKGKGVYQKTGAVPPKKFVAAARHMTTPRLRANVNEAYSNKNIRQMSQQNRVGAGALTRYHQVRDTVRAASKLKKGALMDDDDSGVNTILVKSAPRRPIAKADDSNNIGRMWAERQKKAKEPLKPKVDAKGHYDHALWPKHLCPACKLAKADRRDAGAAVLGGASVGSGVGAVRSRRTMKLKRAESAALHEQAGDGFRTAQARLARQSRTGKGSIRATPTSVSHTHDLIVAARENQSGASIAAREAIRAGRGARGKAAAAAVLGGGAVALGSRRDRQPHSSVGYR